MGDNYLTQEKRAVSSGFEEVVVLESVLRKVQHMRIFKLTDKSITKIKV